MAEFASCFFSYSTYFKSISKHTLPQFHQKTCKEDFLLHVWAQSHILPQLQHAMMSQIFCPCFLWSSLLRPEIQSTHPQNLEKRTEEIIVTAQGQFNLTIHTPCYNKIQSLVMAMIFLQSGTPAWLNHKIRWKPSLWVRRKDKGWCWQTKQLQSMYWYHRPSCILFRGTVTVSIQLKSHYGDKVEEGFNLPCLQQ